VSVTGEIGEKFLFLSLLGIVLVYATESSYQITYFLDSLIKSYNNLAINEALAIDEKIQVSSLRPQDRGIKIGGFPYDIAVNSENNLAYVIDRFYKKISFIDTDTDEIIKTITIPNGGSPNSKYNISSLSSAITVDPHFNLIYISNTGSDMVSAIDALEGNTVANITVDGSPQALAVDNRTVPTIHIVTNNVPKKPANDLDADTIASKVHEIVGFTNSTYNRVTTKNDFLTAIDVDPVTNTAYVTGEKDNLTVYGSKRIYV
jgi:YVTN family beta-propeller protein